MIIEMLYPEIASLYGEKGNLDLLKLCFPEANIRMTMLNDEPAFPATAVCVSPGTSPKRK